ncbi:MAG: ATP-binding cassette domain-containing protein [Bacteroidales bacterium]|nr:ATP-binding cassette domain-containing protein [Bacteroidales bacterium]
MLEIKNLSKELGRFRITDINLSVSGDDYFILLGASGAGKSVLLEIIAGLVKPDSGQIILNGNDITGISVEKRRTGLIFQSPAIFPHLTVRQNIAFPLQHRKSKASKQMVEKLAEQMSVQHLLDQKPAILSGGELQRIALARTLASNPVMLLLDEPLSAVDTPMKSGLRGLLRELNKHGLPILHVTHDFEEAIALATSMAVIENGRIVQTGSPELILNNPNTGFAAGFSGEHNFFKAEISGKSAVVKCKSDWQESVEIKLNDDFEAGPANILIRSKYVILAMEEPKLSTVNNLKGAISSINPSRDGFEVCVSCGIDIYARITRESLEKMELRTGIQVWVGFKASSVDVIR